MCSEKETNTISEGGSTGKADILGEAGVEPTAASSFHSETVSRRNSRPYDHLNNSQKKKKMVLERE